MSWGVPWGGHQGSLHTWTPQERLVCSSSGQQQCVSDTKVLPVGVLHFTEDCIEEGVLDAGTPQETVVSRRCVSDTGVLPVGVFHFTKSYMERALG